MRQGIGNRLQARGDTDSPLLNRNKIIGARVLSLVFVFILGSSLSGCSGSEPKQNSQTKQDNPIQLATVSVQTVQGEVAVPAKVQADPDRVVHVYPPVSGRLISLKVRPGDVVKQGQVIAILQSSDAASARTDYDKARIEAARSSQAEKRIALLLQHEVVPQKDYEDAKAQAETAQSDLARAEQRLRMLGLTSTSNSDEVTVKAPRSGIVLEIGAAAGELSKSLDNAGSIATIADLSSVWIVGDLYEKDLTLATRGTLAKITVAALPDKSWSGLISNVSDVLDPITRTLKVRVVLANPRRTLKPEMFATMHLVSRRQELMTVPTTAILHEGGDAFVMVKRADGTYEKRNVTIANTTAEKTEIASGLRPGETIVTSGAELLRGEVAGS